MAFELRVIFSKQSTVQRNQNHLYSENLSGPQEESFVNNMDNYIVSLGQDFQY
jgi:hypothetical protein